MKNISIKTKIIAILVAIIIIVGMAITLTIGLNFELKYQDTKRMQIYIGKEFEIEDVKQIANEVFGNQEVILQKARELEDVLSVTAKDITDEQNSELIKKINEKYETEINEDQNETVQIPKARGRDLIKPYIAPFIIVTIIILICMLIRYYKLGKLKIILTSVLSVIIAQITLLSIIAITRIPIGRLTIPMVLVVYILTFVGLTKHFDKELEKLPKN